MLRRSFLSICLLAGANPAASAFVLDTVNRRFAFKIKTKDGGIVGNVLIEAHDEDAAKVKLMKRYPGCTIRSVTEK
jgi:hypothetical protein